MVPAAATTITITTMAITATITTTTTTEATGTNMPTSTPLLTATTTTTITITIMPTATPRRRASIGTTTPTRTGRVAAAVTTTLTTMAARRMMVVPTSGTAIGMGEGSGTPAAVPAGSSDRTAGLLDLMVWLSPAFPVGGFTYSHGLEWAIEDGTVTDAAGLEAWLGDVLRFGAGRNDAILFVDAHEAAAAGDIDRLAAAIELAHALQPTRERRLEASAQGAAFVKAIQDSWATPRFSSVAAALSDRFGTIPWTYPVAVATAAACHGIALADSVPATLQAFAANVISAGVRAIPLGQTDGLRILRRLGPVIAEIVAEARALGLEGLGGAAFRADIASMKHETQYTRLFRS